MAATPRFECLTIPVLVSILEELSETCRSSYGSIGRPVLISQRSPRELTITKVR